MSPSPDMITLVGQNILMQTLVQKMLHFLDSIGVRIFGVMPECVGSQLQVPDASRRQSWALSVWNCVVGYDSLPSAS